MIEKRISYQDGGFGSYKDYIEQLPNNDLLLELYAAGDIAELIKELKRRGYDTEDRYSQGGRIRYRNGSKPNGSTPPPTLDQYLDLLDPDGWMEDDKPNEKKLSKKPQGIIQVVSSNMSVDEEREFYGSQLSPFFKKQYLEMLPLQELKELFHEYLYNTGQI
tara:strand:- start:630 stop:1115 length:486 start_codon:yes stop_codon:yes gene_type:complete